MTNNSNDEYPCPYCAQRSAHLERTHAGYRLHCELCDWVTPIDHEHEQQREPTGEVDPSGPFACPGCFLRSVWPRGGNRSERIRMVCDSCSWSGSISEAENFFASFASALEQTIN